jgi:hypothetical protein
MAIAGELGLAARQPAIPVHRGAIVTTGAPRRTPPTSVLCAMPGSSVFSATG